VFSNGGIGAASVVGSVEARHGVPVFSDGAYARTPEHVGGLAVIDVPDDETARYWAGRIAVAVDWPQEVHRFPSPHWSGPADSSKQGKSQW
jgi:hypothetical protein